MKILAIHSIRPMGGHPLEHVLSRPGCVIIITAAMRELARFDPGTVYATIAKPFDIDHLRDTVRECVHARTAVA